MTINPQAVEWLQARAIDPETASRMGIYTAGRGSDGEPRPDPAGNILVFPYVDGGSEVNAKYRTLGEKRFWQRKDARKTFFNADILDDPALERGDHALVITEGELDALAAIQSGFPFTVSVPDGAPSARDEQGNLVAVAPTTSRPSTTRNTATSSTTGRGWRRSSGSSSRLTATSPAGAWPRNSPGASVEPAAPSSPTRRDART
jgi:twinkle protein